MEIYGLADSRGIRLLLHGRRQDDPGPRQRSPQADRADVRELDCRRAKTRRKIILMHIPDGFLTPPLWVSFDIASAGLVGLGLRRVSRTLEDRAVPLMGVLAAFTFATQMLN